MLAGSMNRRPASFRNWIAVYKSGRRVHLHGHAQASVCMCVRVCVYVHSVCLLAFGREEEELKLTHTHTNMYARKPKTSSHPVKAPKLRDVRPVNTFHSRAIINCIAGCARRPFRIHNEIGACLMDRSSDARVCSRVLRVYSSRSI